jgi:hypothetical protein
MSIGAGPQLTNYPYGFANGVSIRGLPIVQTAAGRTFWVYNGTALINGGRGGSDGNTGSFQSPFSSITGALAQCLAGRGDTIFVKPGHAESITAAAGIALNVTGVQIVGLGYGNQRPTFTFTTATTAQIAVTAAGMSFQNCVFDLTGFDAVAAGISVAAADFTFAGNDVILANATNQAVLGIITTAAADRFLCDSNRFRGTSDAGTTAAMTVVGGDSIQITNNVMYGAYTAGIGGINNITTAMTNSVVDGNRINNLTASSTKAMVFVSGSTGMISNNRMQILSGSAPITGAAMSWVGGNYYAATIGQLGVLI